MTTDTRDQSNVSYQRHAYADVIKLYKRDVDRTLLLENLRLTPQQRFEKFERVMAGLDALRSAGRRQRNNDSSVGTKHPEISDEESVQTIGTREDKSS